MQNRHETQFTLLKQMFRLAQELRVALRSDQFQRFEALLERRQEIIDALAEAPADAYPDNVIPFPGHSSAVEDEIALRALLQRILEIDEENEILLREKVTSLSSTLRHLHRGRQAARGYAAPRPQQARLDQAG